MNAREVALAVVRDVFPAEGCRPAGGQERGAQEALDYRTRKANLGARDRAFATELAYGAIKMRRTLDWYLDPFIGPGHPERGASNARGRRTIAPAVLEILRLAIYELVYTRADEHATVFEWVNLAKKYGHRGLGDLVNAVLRNFLRERPLPPAREHFESDDDYLATRYSLPTWLVRQWHSVFGELTEAICAAVNDPARAAVTVNTIKGSRDEVGERLRSAGVATAPSAFVPESLIVEGGGALLGALEQQADGSWWIQSESSAMPVDITNPQPGEAVLDVCSGRGNKALQIGARLSGEGTLLSIERDQRKAEVLGRRLDAAGVPAGTIIGDATGEVLQPGQRFDRILVDAPCSGVGVIGRHPEARWKKQGTDGERLAMTQRALLERAARHVHPGGALVYAVCSTDPRETMEVIDWFVSRENFVRGLIPAAYAPLLTADGDVLVPPGIGGRDGFYIARLERGA